MTTDKRVTYNRSHSYNTRSNRVRKVVLPGGKVVLHSEAKPAKGPRCGDTGVALQGVRARARARSRGGGAREGSDRCAAARRRSQPRSRCVARGAS